MAFFVSFRPKQPVVCAHGAWLCAKSAATPILLATAVSVMTGLFSPSAAQNVLVVKDDPGGNISEMLSRVDQLRALGTRVEIRGFCASACTMLLGLPNACVAPTSRLGFHGPQSQYYGIALPKDEFDYWSDVLAAHYPGTLRDWFMKKARNVTLSLVTLNGKQAIQMGAKKCDARNT